MHFPSILFSLLKCIIINCCFCSSHFRLDLLISHLLCCSYSLFSSSPPVSFFLQIFSHFILVPPGVIFVLMVMTIIIKSKVEPPSACTIHCYHPSPLCFLLLLAVAVQPVHPLLCLLPLPTHQPVPNSGKLNQVQVSIPQLCKRRVVWLFPAPDPACCCISSSIYPPKSEWHG